MTKANVIIKQKTKRQTFTMLSRIRSTPFLSGFSSILLSGNAASYF